MEGLDKYLTNEPMTNDKGDCCAECGKEMDDMEHNYGTEDILICIHCYQLAQDK